MRVQFIAIVGGSGSGKTWLAERLLEELGDQAGRLSLDDFYGDQSHLTPAERRGVNFDHPNAIDWLLFKRTLKAIGHGEKAFLPTYDFATHTRQAVKRQWQPRQLVMLDGLWLLRSAQLRKSYSFSVFSECPESLRRQRRLYRDRHERGRSAATINRQFDQQVAPMHGRFIAPQSRLADIVIQSPPTIAQLKTLGARCRELLNHERQK